MQLILPLLYLRVPKAQIALLHKFKKKISQSVCLGKEFIQNNYKQKESPEGIWNKEKWDDHLLEMEVLLYLIHKNSNIFNGKSFMQISFSLLLSSPLKV